MFGRQSKKEKHTDIPALNPQPYEGTLEEVLAEKRQERQRMLEKMDLQSLFEKYRIRLDKNITSGYSRDLYAGFWSRLWALVVDLIIVNALQILVLGIISYFMAENMTLLYPSLSFVIDKLIVVLYFTLSAYWMNGQTLGKGLMGIQLVINDFHHLPFSVALIREGFGKVILLQFPILALFAVVSPKRQNFMDYFTDTNVISLKQFKLLYEENQI